MQTINKKIVNCPTRNAADVEFTNEEWAKIKGYIEENADYGFTTFGLDNVDVLALYIKLQINELANYQEFFYNDCGLEGYMFDLAKALLSLTRAKL